MDLYADADPGVPEDIARQHEVDLASFAVAGSWLSGEERAAVVRHVRSVRVAGGLQSPQPADGGPDPQAILPRPMLDLIAAIALDPANLNRATLDTALAGGMSDTEYVEVTGLVSRIVNLDIFARGLGIAPRILPSPVDGEPDYERPDTAVMEGAWVASIPSGPAGGSAGEALYGKNMMPFIYRALSLVPREAALIIAGGNAQYLRLDRFFDFAYSLYPALTRAQVEVVAGRVSAHNECFY